MSIGLFFNRVFILSGILFFATGVQAKQLDYRGGFVEYSEPTYLFCDGNVELAEHLARGAITSLQNILLEINERHPIPDLVMDYDTIVQMDRHEDEIVRSVGRINEFIAKQRERRGGEWGWHQLCPKALVVVGGASFGKKSFLVAPGGSVAIGLVVMPTIKSRYDSRTGEFLGAYFSPEMAIVGWPNADIGLGIGEKTSSGRLFGGFIWDIEDVMAKAEDFHGFAMGGSGTAAGLPSRLVSLPILSGLNTFLAGRGVNVKLGGVKQVSRASEAQVEFAYLLFGSNLSKFTQPPRVRFESHVNIASVLSFDSLIKMLGTAVVDSSRRQEQAIQDAIRRAVEDALIDPDMQPRPPGRGTTNPPRRGVQAEAE